MTITLPTAVSNSLPRGNRARAITEPVDVALVRLLEGNGEPDDVLKIGLALNLTSTRLKWISGSEPGRALIAQAGLTLMQLDDTGSTSLADFSPQAKQVLLDAFDLYEETVRRSSPLQMEQAQRELVKLMTPRKVHRA